MDSIMGKKTVFACGVAVGAGSVIIGVGSFVLFSKILRKIRWKKAVNFPVKMFRKCDHILHSLFSREEELEPVELWLVVNRVEDVHLEKPIAQAVVVIKNQTLQKLNKSKWVSASLEQQQPFDIIETSPPLFQVNPSLQAAFFIAVCDGYSSLYLLGGQYYWTRASNSSSMEVTYCINVTNVVSGKTKQEEEEEAQHCYPIPRVRNRVARAAVTSERKIYVFGQSRCVYSPGPGVDGDCDSSTFGEIYDMDEKCWTDLEKAPFKDAPRCSVIGCVMWRSIIVLFMHRTVKIRRGRRRRQKEELEVAGNTKKYRQVTKVSYYDLKQKKWISTVTIDVEIMSMQCSPVLVDDNVFLVKASELYRYDLVEKRITGKIQGLKQMKELIEHVIADVVYLGSCCSGSDDKKYLKFCIFWECYRLPNNKFMRFCIIKVGDDNKLTVSISSSVASFPVEQGDHFIKGGAHIIIRDKHMMLDEQARHREEE